MGYTCQKYGCWKCCVPVSALPLHTVHSCVPPSRSANRMENIIVVTNKIAGLVYVPGLLYESYYCNVCVCVCVCAGDHKRENRFVSHFQFILRKCLTVPKGDNQSHACTFYCCICAQTGFDSSHAGRKEKQ